MILFNSSEFYSFSNIFMAPQECIVHAPSSLSFFLVVFSPNFSPTSFGFLSPIKEMDSYFLGSEMDIYAEKEY